MSHAIAIQVPDYFAASLPAMPAAISKAPVRAEFIPASHVVEIEDQECAGPITEAEFTRFPWRRTVSAPCPVVRWRSPRVAVEFTDGGGRFELVAPAVPGSLRADLEIQQMADWDSRLREIARLATAPKPRKGAKAARGTNKAMAEGKGKRIAALTLESALSHVTTARIVGGDGNVISNGRYLFRVSPEVVVMASRECSPEKAHDARGGIKAEQVAEILRRAESGLESAWPNGRSVEQWLCSSADGEATAVLSPRTPLAEVLAHGRIFDGGVDARVCPDPEPGDGPILRFDARFMALGLTLFPTATLRLTSWLPKEDAPELFHALAFTDRDGALLGIVASKNYPNPKREPKA